MSTGAHADRLNAQAAAPHSRRANVGPIAAIAGFAAAVPLLGWPFLVARNEAGGYYGWVWLVAAVWWATLAVVYMRVSGAIRESRGAQEHRLEREMGLSRGQLAGTRFQCELCGSDEYRVPADHPAAGVVVRCAGCRTLHTVTRKEPARG